MQILQPGVLGPATIVDARARRWWTRRVDVRDAPTATAVVDLMALAPATGQGLRLASPPDHLVVRPRRWRQRRPRAWAHALRGIVRAPADDVLAAAAAAAVEPLPYQWVPAMALLSGRTRRLLLADAVGLGKTVQAALVLAELHARLASACSLVVVPAGLLTQWADELQHRVGLAATVLDGHVLAARTATGSGGGIALPGETCLLSLDLLRQPEIGALVARQLWQILVVDEAHLSAPGTARADALQRTASVACQVLLLSATPFTGDAAVDRHLLVLGRRDGEADRMLVVARRKATGPPGVATQRVAWVRARADERAMWTSLDAWAQMAAGDAARLVDTMLRRRACSSPDALARTARRRAALLGSQAAPPAEQVGLPFEDAEAEADREAEVVLRLPAWRDVAAERAALRTLARLADRVQGRDAKALWLRRWLRRVGEPVLVFTEFVDTLRALRRLLAPCGRVTVLHGAQSSAQRAGAIDAFTRGEVDVLLATDAAAEGLNLHARCHVVVHVDVPWTPRRLAQRTGRVDRLGQHRRVHSACIALRDTLDEDVVARLRTRTEAVAHATAALDVALAVRASARREPLALVACAATSASRLPRASSGAHAGTHDDLIVAHVSPRRGRRLTARLGVATASPLALVEVDVRGTHPLAAARRWLAAAGPAAAAADAHALAMSAARGAASHAAAPSESRASAPWDDWPPVRRLLARVRHRAARWQRLTSAAVEALPRPDAPGLFSEATVPSEPSMPAREASVSVCRMRVLRWAR